MARTRLRRLPSPQARSTAARLSWLDQRIAGRPQQDVRRFADLLLRFADGLGDRST